MADPKSILRFIGRGGRRVAVTIVGGVVLLVGIVGIVAPVIPGPILIVAGLAILATEYAWARRALNKAREKAKEARQRLRDRRQAKRDAKGPN